MLDRVELIEVELRWDRFEKLVLEVIGKPLEKLSSPSDADYRFKADPALQMQRSGADSSLA